LKEWVKGCDKNGIEINGDEARAAVADYRLECGEPVQVVGMNSQARRSFTNENFTKALVKFVVSDDQVCTPGTILRSSNSFGLTVNRQ